MLVFNDRSYNERLQEKLTRRCENTRTNERILETGNGLHTAWKSSRCYHLEFLIKEHLIKTQNILTEF